MILSFYLVMKRLMITKNSVMKFQNLVVCLLQIIDEQLHIKLSLHLYYIVFESKYISVSDAQKHLSPANAKQRSR